MYRKNPAAALASAFSVRASVSAIALAAAAGVALAFRHVGHFDPHAVLAMVDALRHADPHAVAKHVITASPVLSALRAKETDLAGRITAKLAEIDDKLDADALRTIETDHDKLVGDLEQVRAKITEVQAIAAVDPSAIRAGERERISGIRALGRKLSLKDAIVDAAIDGGTTLDGFRAVAIDEVAARQAEPTLAYNPGASDPAHRTYAQPKGERAKGTDATRAMIALAACRGSRRDAADFVSQHYGPEGTHVARALATSVGSAGGFLVPVDMAAEVIELLRPASTVMALSPVIIPMPHGNMSIPRITGGASAGYVGENQPTQGSQPSFGMVSLSAKKLTSVVPISNDMIRFPSAATDAIVRNDMVLSIAMRADLAFLRGQGTQFSPRGLKSFAAAPALAGTNVLPANTLVGSAYASAGQAQTINALASVTFDLSRAELALENANIQMTRPGWIFSPRTKQYLMNIRDGLGNQTYYAEMSNGRLRGKPFKVTTQIPNNLAAVDQNGAATTDGSEVYLADFAEVYIGEAHGLELDVFPGGTYVDSNGATVSGISNDQTVMRAIVQHDMNMRQEAAVALLTGVRWF